MSARAWARAPDPSDGPLQREVDAIVHRILAIPGIEYGDTVTIRHVKRPYRVTYSIVRTLDQRQPLMVLRLGAVLSLSPGVELPPLTRGMFHPATTSELEATIGDGADLERRFQERVWARAHARNDEVQRQVDELAQRIIAVPGLEARDFVLSSAGARYEIRRTRARGRVMLMRDRRIILWAPPEVTRLNG